MRECSVLQPPANGHVNCTGRSVEGSTCIVTCDPGYEVQGPPSTTCLASKQWETDAFACEGDKFAPNYFCGYVCMYVYIYITKKKKRLNKLFIHYAQIFGPVAFLGGAKTPYIKTPYIQIYIKAYELSTVLTYDYIFNTFSTYVLRPHLLSCYSDGSPD